MTELTPKHRLSLYRGSLRIAVRRQIAADKRRDLIESCRWWDKAQVLRSLIRGLKN